MRSCRSWPGRMRNFCEISKVSMSRLRKKDRICGSICQPSGRVTVNAVADAGLAGMVIEAEKVMILDRDATLQAARDRGSVPRFPEALTLRVFLIAGEASGDRLGAALMEGLRSLDRRRVSRCWRTADGGAGHVVHLPNGRSQRAWYRRSAEAVSASAPSPASGGQMRYWRQIPMF